MLVLSRRQGEEICVDRDVTIRVLKVHGRRVRLGITAPDRVRVVRKELVDVPPPAQWEVAVGCSDSSTCPLGEESTMNTDVSSQKEDRPTAPAAILLAEDDADMRSELNSRLRREGYAVTQCSNGAELLSELAGYFEPTVRDSASVYDCIVSDIRMPGVFGSTVTEGARDIAGFPPTILITAFGSEETHEAARQCGVVAVFDKPFAMKDLLQKVREAITRDHSSSNV